MRGLSLVVASGGHSSSRCAGLSLLWLLLLRSTGSRRAGSVIVAHGPSCSVACGIFPDQGFPCIGRQTLNHCTTREAPTFFFFFQKRLLYFFSLFIDFLAVFGLCRCAWAFSSCGERRLLFIAVASLVAEHRLVLVSHELSGCGLWTLERRLSSGGAGA